MENSILQLFVSYMLYTLFKVTTDIIAIPDIKIKGWDYFKQGSHRSSSNSISCFCFIASVAVNFPYKKSTFAFGSVNLD